ncbi:hypothetical protein ACQY0O_004622 [Thecaphora frezii]
MTTMDGDDMQRLWSLIEDLTQQLQANRQLCESLQAQADQLKGQALHSGTGYALRRFNLDISKEKFESELEQLNAYLVKENQTLAHENKQQAMLLREYENTLETVMGKFRSFSHSTQQHTLQLTAHYENLLARTTQTAAETTLAAETAFSGTLQHLGGLVRRALRTMDGEASGSDDEHDDDDDDEHEDGAAYASASGRSRHRPQGWRHNGWPADPRWYGSGGYTGKELDPEVERSERALAMLTDEERLRIENETLRELLQLKERSDALIIDQAAGVGPAAGTEASAAPNAAAASSSPSTPAKPSAASMGAGGGGRLSPTLQRSPSSPTASRNPLAIDQAAIEAEGSGQPPLKALEISETLRPGERSPQRSPTQRKDQILEEAILEEEQQQQEQGGKEQGEAEATTASSSSDGQQNQNQQQQQQQQPHEAPEQPDVSSQGLAPSLVAEAAPSALLLTGIEEGKGNTLVMAVSGSKPAGSTVDAGPSQSATEADATGSSEAGAAAEAVGDYAPTKVAGGGDAEAEVAVPAEPTTSGKEAETAKAQQREEGGDAEAAAVSTAAEEGGSTV